MKDVYYSGIIQGNKTVFAIICNDKRTKTMGCFFFIYKNASTEIPPAFSQAFAAAKALQVDPFALHRPHINTLQLSQDHFLQTQITRSNLQTRAIIGQGQFGQVFLADYQPGVGGRTGQEVAVKLMRPEASHVDAVEFIGEAYILRQFDHPKCIKLVGTCFEHMPWLIVLEFMQYKDLGVVLRQCRKHKVLLRSHEQLTFMEQVAVGLKYLTDRRYIHRDIAARNIMLHHNNEVS